MEQQRMNCFKWQNHCSDYLDGTLSEALKRQADEHLESCEECTERSKHYRTIISSIASQPRSNLPAQIKKAPLLAVLPRIDTARITRSRWERVPWYIRTIIEGLGIVCIILVGITSMPKIRSLYERNIEKTLSDFKDSLATNTDAIGDGSDAKLLGSMNQANHPTNQAGDQTSQNTSQNDTSASAAISPAGSTSDDLSGEDEEEEGHEAIRVGRSQLWRFTLKTVSPDELRPQVIKTLKTLDIPPNTPGLEGIKVPGGIEFDLLLPQSVVPDIKHALQKLAPPLPERAGTSDPNGSDSFSWYKVKSKRKVPEGKSQVVIWLSQPN